MDTTPTFRPSLPEGGFYADAEEAQRLAAERLKPLVTARQEPRCAEPWPPLMVGPLFRRVTGARSRRLWRMNGRFVRFGIAGALAGILSSMGFSAPGEAPARTADAASIALDEAIRETAMKRKPAVMDLTIGYHEIRGLEGQFRWHILDTRWWVALHNTGVTLDKTKQYEVHGVVLDQVYGTINVWVYRLNEKK